MQDERKYQEISTSDMRPSIKVSSHVPLAVGGMSLSQTNEMTLAEHNFSFMYVSGDHGHALFPK